MSVKIIAIDPGTKNTGFALFDHLSLLGAGVIGSKNHDIDVLFDLIQIKDVQTIVLELFHLFPFKAKEQSWDQLRVVQVIGIIKYLAEKQSIPVILQEPNKKQAFPDARLTKDGYYVPNNHARDAIRHGLYFFKFGEGKKYVLQ